MSVCMCVVRRFHGRCVDAGVAQLLLGRFHANFHKTYTLGQNSNFWSIHQQRFTSIIACNKIFQMVLLELGTTYYSKNINL